MRFGGHESFYLRETWLSKGLEQVSHDATIFEQKHAEDIFGIGKNMLQSILFWMRAARLISKERGGHIRIEPLGEMILAYDPYMIKPETWWMIHLNLMTHEQSLHVFPWLFKSLRGYEFTIDDLMSQAISYFKFKKEIRFSERTIQKDLSCLMNTYLPKGIGEHPEDYYLSPLSILNLIRPASRAGRFKINVADRSLSGELLTYALWSCNRQPSEEPLFAHQMNREFKLENIYSSENNPLTFLAITDDWFSKVLIDKDKVGPKAFTLSNIAGSHNLILNVHDERTLIQLVYSA